MFKNWIRYCLPATLIALALLGISIASNLQSWQSGTAGNVASVDSLGGFNITGSGSFNASYAGTATITGGSMAGSAVLYSGSNVVTGGTLSAGTLSVFEPFQGSEYKQLVIAGSGVTATSNTLAITFPTAFTTTPGTMCSALVGNTTTASMALAPMSSSGITGGTLTVSSSASSGTFILGGR